MPRLAWWLLLADISNDSGFLIGQKVGQLLPSHEALAAATSLLPSATDVLNAKWASFGMLCASMLAHRVQHGCK